MRVLVVQHARKHPTPGDPGLTPEGREEAARAAGWLAGARPAAVWSSPLRRAVETAAPIATALGVEVVVDARLRERMNWAGPDGVGEVGGQSLDEFLEEWRRATADRALVPRSGDSSLAAATRFLDALDDVASRHPAATVVVVAHGGVTTDALRTLLGDDELRARSPDLIDGGVPGGAVTTFERTGGGWSVPSIAATGRLDVTR